MGLPSCSHTEKDSKYTVVDRNSPIDPYLRARSNIEEQPVGAFRRAAGCLFVVKCILTQL